MRHGTAIGLARQEEYSINIMEFLDLLKTEKNDDKFYTFNAKIKDIDCDIFVKANFKQSNLKIELCIYQNEKLKSEESNVIQINLDKTNVLKEYTLKHFGKPTRLSSMFSAINKPFYIYKWKTNTLSITHKYQDSAGGIYESLFIVTK